MAFKKPKEESPVDLNMIPMIDVIFQLLIFFMLSPFKSLEGKLFSHLPKDKGLENTQVANPETDEFRIRLAFDPSVKEKLFTRIKVGRNMQEVDSWEELQLEVQVVYDAQKDRPKPLPFIIDPEPKVPFQSVVNAMNTCKAAGVNDIEFAAKTAVADELKRSK